MTKSTLFRWRSSWGEWTYRNERPAGWENLPHFEAYALVGGIAEPLVEALLLALDHIDMEALEISHCKDAAFLRAALSSVNGDDTAVAAPRQPGEVSADTVNFPSARELYEREKSHWQSSDSGLVSRIDSASAQQEERETFEAYIASLKFVAGHGQKRVETCLRRDIDGNYCENWVDSRWKGWNARPAPEALGAAGVWVSIGDEMPHKLRTVLASYTNCAGKPRIIRAKFVPAKTVEANSDADDSACEYDEETDTYWCQEGWYEQIDNWDDYSSVAVCEGDVTHWMPMPSAPAILAKAKEQA